jgi:ATP-dependent Clp protease protease subunit
MISNSESKGAAVSKKFDDFNAEDRIDIKLLENSIHFLTGEIDQESIDKCIKWITYENLDTRSEKTLTLYINSTGGDLYSAFALIDVIKNSEHPVRTIAMGAVMSAAFLIAASGAKGQRFAARNVSYMCHQFTENVDAKYHDIKAAMKGNDMCNDMMVNVLKEATGLAPSIIKKKLLPASDVYLTAEEAVELKIADNILER